MHLDIAITIKLDETQMESLKEILTDIAKSKKLFQEKKIEPPI